MKMVMHYPLVPGQDFKLPDACQVLSVGLREDDLSAPARKFSTHASRQGRSLAQQSIPCTALSMCSIWDG